jgi:hypothetical protein
MLVDHVSPEGATITHVRGIMLANALRNVREVGQYDTYLRLLPPDTASALTTGVATAWLPVSHVVAHYQTCDQLPIDGDAFAGFGRRQAAQVRDTFLGMAIQRANALRLTDLKATLARVGQLHDRIYRGGGCAAIDLGPKDVIFEISGFPFATSHAFQSGWVAYSEAMARMFARAVSVTLTRPRALHPHRLALQVSWV